jgi:hypothetical protein
MASIITVMNANLIGRKMMANVFLKSLVAASASILMTGCVVYTRPAPAPVVTEVVVDPGVEVVEVEPAPEERIYVYDPGFPPGCYLVGGFYWYNGSRYDHDVFMNRYVTVNIREGRYTNAEENRRVGVKIEVQHRAEYAKAQTERANAPRAQAERTDPARRDTAAAADAKPGLANSKTAKKPQKPGQPVADAR